MNRRNALAGAAAVLGVSAVRRSASAQLVRKLAYELRNGEFNWFPERSAAGPMLIIVSIPDQLLHVYRNGIRIAASTCSTGKPGHRTPVGVFKILEKDKHHRSSTYSNAPMPNMNRLTWDGVALHAGHLPGYPASHGCVRLPMQFSEMLFDITRKGMTVIIADERSHPSSVTHPGMVLGDYAAREFGAVNTALMKSAYSAGHVDRPNAVSVVVSRKDHSVSLLEDDRIVAQGKVEIEGGRKPLGETVYTLTGSKQDQDSLDWSGVGYGKGDRLDIAREIRRVKAEPAIREEIRKRMQPGMTVVTTDQSHTEAHRASNFTILEGIY